MRKPFLIFISVLFFANILGSLPLHADALLLPKSGTMVQLSERYNPLLLKGMKVYPNNPLRFDFILDKGQNDSKDLNKEITTLSKYFLAALTTPEKDLWVNLSPYEKDRIVPESFGQTEMGRDLLAQDYLLKQITASLIYPEDALGKKFWNRIYEESAKQFGTTNIPVSTFNKVWIVPSEAIVNENAQAGTAIVTKSRLKVLLEEDFLAVKKNVIKSRSTLQEQTTKAIIREIVIPALETEVNEGKNFAKLRQVYSALILAAWYKQKIKDSILNDVYVNKNKVTGINIANPQEKQVIYNQYVEAFKLGAYNYIKETQLPDGTSIPKKYFSGGFSGQNLFDAAMSILKIDTDMQGLNFDSNDVLASVNLKELRRKNSTRKSLLGLTAYAFIVIVGKAIRNHLVQKTKITNEDYRYLYADRIETIFSDLRMASKRLLNHEAIDNKQKRGLFVDFNNHLQATIQNGADLKGMSTVAEKLTKLKRLFPADGSVTEVSKAWFKMQKIYWLDEKGRDPAKPTMLIVHGTGIGPFPSFNEFIEHHRHEYNIAFIVYDFRRSLKTNAKLLKEQWAYFKKRYNINPTHELNKEIMVTYSFGDNILKLAALEEPSLFKNASLLSIAPVILGSKLISMLNSIDKRGILNRFYMSLATYRHMMSPQNLIQLELLNTSHFSMFGNRTLTLIPEEDHHLDYSNKKVWQVLEKSPRLFMMEGTHLKAASNPVAIKAVSFLKELAEREDSGFGNLEPIVDSGYGGIDMTAESLPLHVKADGSKIAFNVDPAMRVRLNNSVGFEPIIFQIKPMLDVPNFFGASK